MQRMLWWYYKIFKSRIQKAIKIFFKKKKKNVFWKLSVERYNERKEKEGIQSASTKVLFIIQLYNSVEIFIIWYQQLFQVLLNSS